MNGVQESKQINLPSEVYRRIKSGLKSIGFNCGGSFLLFVLSMVKKRVLAGGDKSYSVRTSLDDGQQLKARVISALEML